MKRSSGGAANTATDLAEDSHNLPGRVFRVSQLGYGELLRFCTALAASMLAFAVLLGPHFTFFMTLAVVGLHQYSAPPVRSKGRPLLGLWMLISSGFNATLLLLVAPSWASVVFVLSGALVLLGSDWLGLDSRCSAHVRRTA